jgi:chemotaxis protein CheX
MTFDSTITTLLDSTIESIQSVIPIKASIEHPVPKLVPLNHNCFGVLITITGDFEGKMLIESNKNVFSKLGMCMYGMPLPEGMLESFVGEIGNMIAGNLSTNCSKKEVIIDISTPTVFDSTTIFSRFTQAVSLPIQLHQTGELSIVLVVE